MKFNDDIDFFNESKQKQANHTITLSFRKDASLAIWALLRIEVEKLEIYIQIRGPVFISKTVFILVT